MAIRLATGPVSWGVDFADAPDNPPWPLVLDEVVAAGLDALELGPAGYLPEDGDVLRGELRARGLTAVGGFVFDDLHARRRRADVLAAAARAARVASVAGGTVLVVIDRVSDERAATAGRSDAARRLTGADWRALVDCAEGCAEIGRAHGLRPVFHPHAGSFVEFADEIDALLGGSSLDLCLDTGHAAYAGVAVEDLCGERVGHVHLKDVVPAVVERGLGFWDAIAAGVFCPLGRGAVDLGAVLRGLADAGYDGFATIEQDRAADTGSPVADLRASVAHVRRELCRGG